MRSVAGTILELGGAAVIGVAAWLVDYRLGMVAIGVGLILAGYIIAEPTTRKG